MHNKELLIVVQLNRKSFIYQEVNFTLIIFLFLSFCRFTSPTNRSLYDELKAEEEENRATSLPLFTSSEFDSSSELSSLKKSSDDDDHDDDNKSSDLSLESAFKANENDFKKNATKEMRHQIDEVRIDGRSIKYSSRNQTMPNESDEYEEEKEEVTTALPLTKKGKYLDLMPPGEDNMNASLPNTAEVWALAGMRQVDARKSSSTTTTTEEDNDVELLNSNMNTNAKSLLDWTEIAKLDNETTTTVKSIVSGDIHDDPSTAENKEVAVSTASVIKPTQNTTIKNIIEDNRIELEHDSVEFNNANKTEPVISRIDTDLFDAKSDEKQQPSDDDVELLPINNNSKNNRNDNGKQQHKKENLIEKITEFEAATTTESSEKFTTPSSLLFESDESEQQEEEAEIATTMESVEATTTTASGIDSFTIIGEDEVDDESGNGNNVAKRTITEMPDLQTDEFATSTIIPLTTLRQTTTTTTPFTTTTDFYDMQTTTDETELSSSSSSQSVERFNKSTMVTKSISIRIAMSTTTEQPEEFDTTAAASSESGEFYSSTTARYDDSSEAISSTSSTPFEITSDDKFRYSTFLPETTTTVIVNLLDTSRSGKNGGDFGTVSKDADSLNKESLDGETGGSNVVIISVSVSIVVFILLAAGGFVSFFIK